MNNSSGSRGNRPHSMKGGKPSLGWKGELKQLIEANNRNHGVRNKVVSVGTQVDREEILFMIFNQLRNLGYLIKNPDNFQERHFKVLLRLWLGEGLSASTIQKRTSVIRVMTTWINKSNMIKKLALYVEPEELHRVTRNQVAEVDRSWTQNGVSSQDIIKQIEAYDNRSAAQMKMIEAFGLRREEALCFRPRRAIALGQESGSILVEFGTKGNRPRILQIDSEEKRAALDYALSIAKTMDEHIGWPELSLKQAIRRYTYIMDKFKITKKGLGVTGHGLRHEVLNNKYEEVTGQPSPVRGGKKEGVNSALDRKAREITTAIAGHSRLGVTASYFGSFNTKKNYK